MQESNVFLVVQALNLYANLQNYKPNGTDLTIHAKPLQSYTFLYTNPLETKLSGMNF